MKNIISFIIILFLISLAGIIWGVYEFQTANGLKTSQTLTMIRSYLISWKPKKPPENNQKPAPEMIVPPEKSIPEEMLLITPVESAPITPTKIELRRMPKIEKPKVKTEAQRLVEDGNQYYDAGVIHLQNTFKKDETFDKENDLAINTWKPRI